VALQQTQLTKQNRHTSNGQSNQKSLIYSENIQKLCLNEKLKKLISQYPRVSYQTPKSLEKFCNYEAQS